MTTSGQDWGLRGMSRRHRQGGVWNLHVAGRPKPYGVQWRETAWDAEQKAERTKRLTEFYETAEQRDARATALRKQRKGGSLLTATRSEIEQWRAFQHAVNGTPWQEIVAGWRAWLLQNGMQECTLTVEQAASDYLAVCERRVALQQMSPDTLRQKRQKLALFSEQFGHLKLNQVQGADVETWIEDFDEVQTEATFNNYRKQVRAMFEPHVAAGLLRRNPIDSVKPRDDSTGEVGILTVPQAARLFTYALKSDEYSVALGRLALEAFVGLRFSSGCRLEKKDINFEDRGILLPKRKLKTKKRHYIDGLPPQVWDWLAVTPEACWDLTARQYMELKSNLFTDAGVPHPHNDFRHSFCTYDVAAHKNPGRTAYILCHRNQDLLWDRYKGNTNEAEGKRYQSITPQTAESLAQDFVPQAARERPAA